MSRLETTLGLVLIALCGLVLWSTADLAWWPGTTPGPRFAPVWVAVLGIVLSLLMIRLAVLRPTPRRVDLPDRRGALRLVLIAAALWAVVGLSHLLGFVPAAALFCLVYCFAIMRCPLLPGLLATFCITAILQGVFVMLLDVKLPQGVLGL